jgi:hypothetical protein
MRVDCHTVDVPSRWPYAAAPENPPSGGRGPVAPPARAQIENDRHVQDPDALTIASLCRDLALLARTAADRLDDAAQALTIPPPAPIVPPASITPGPAIVLSPARGLTYNPGPEGGPDRAKLAKVFGVDPAADGGRFGFWADPSTSLAVNPDGRLAVVFDRARRTTSPNSGGSSWVNAAIPLPAPLAAARLSMTVQFGTGPYPWEWGTSGKLPGLMAWTDGVAPGGGRVGPRNMSVRPCWNDWDRDGAEVRLGPYIYGQHTERVQQQIWETKATAGTLRWGAPVIPALTATTAPEVDLDLDIIPSGADGWADVAMWLDGSRVWAERVKLMAHGPVTITHLQFTAMYGGHSLDFGPRAPITAMEIADLSVVAL